jgi:hypothetical protein
MELVFRADALAARRHEAHIVDGDAMAKDWVVAARK